MRGGRGALSVVVAVEALVEVLEVSLIERCSLEAASLILFSVLSPLVSTSSSGCCCSLRRESFGIRGAIQAHQKPRETGHRCRDQEEHVLLLALHQPELQFAQNPNTRCYFKANSRCSLVVELVFNCMRRSFAY